MAKKQKLNETMENSIESLRFYHSNRLRNEAYARPFGGSMPDWFLERVWKSGYKYGLAAGQAKKQPKESE